MTLRSYTELRPGRGSAGFPLIWDGLPQKREVCAPALSRKIMVWLIYGKSVRDKKKVIIYINLLATLGSVLSSTDSGQSLLGGDLAWVI